MAGITINIREIKVIKGGGFRLKPTVGRRVYDKKNCINNSYCRDVIFVFWMRIKQ